MDGNAQAQRCLIRQFAGYAKSISLRYAATFEEAEEISLREIVERETKHLKIITWIRKDNRSRHAWLIDYEEEVVLNLETIHKRFCFTCKWSFLRSWNVPDTNTALPNQRVLE